MVASFSFLFFFTNPEWVSHKDGEMGMEKEWGGQYLQITNHMSALIRRICRWIENMMDIRKHATACSRIEVKISANVNWVLKAGVGNVQVVSECECGSGLVNPVKNIAPRCWFIFQTTPNSLSLTDSICLEGRSQQEAWSVFVV
eukprot:TRINITY_DN2255_c0_g1_i13.p1 TRINITY_DN2255_c0_g1~~TRINITY_DN2255_c0_g1_i13.p1  ORF type:complete len:144 (-),score=13.48 TRINITY_DN2255_c0_g1_i13:451-882(-)